MKHSLAFLVFFLAFVLACTPQPPPSMPTRTTTPSVIPTPTPVPKSTLAKIFAKPTGSSSAPEPATVPQEARQPKVTITGVGYPADESILAELFSSAGVFVAMEFLPGQPNKTNASGAFVTDVQTDSAGLTLAAGTYIMKVTSLSGVAAVTTVVITGAPTATATPVPPSPTPSPTPAPADPSSDAPPERDLYDLTARLVLKDGRPIPPVVNPQPVSYAPGRKDTFHVTDIPNRTVHTVTATLHLVTPHAYWYVDDAVQFTPSALERASRRFEEVIYPRVTAVFGAELSPGIDNDVHMTILHTPLNGVAGYFSGADEYPVLVHPHSNQREMFYLDVGGLPIGSESYLGTLAHEFTHAVQFRADAAEAGWVNEGLAEFGKRVAGYSPSFEGQFMSAPPVSLTNWPLSLGSTGSYYGAASLFMDYLAGQFGVASMGMLMEEQADSLEGVKQFLAQEGGERTLRQVFADWLVANYLDDAGGGPYGYPDRVVGGMQPRPLKAGESVSDSVPQYAARYFALPASDQGLRLTFQGQPQTPIIPVRPPSGEHCWWGNRGDSIDAMLTGRFDLDPTQAAALEFSIWQEIEEGWDFAYVEASADGGKTWDILPGQHTVEEQDGLKNAFGPGYTGSSGGWLRERIDLSAYAGKTVLLRFEYVTDDAIHGAGLCIDDIAVFGAGFQDDAESNTGVWISRGFIRTSYQTPQDYLLRLVTTDAQGIRVTDIPVDAEGRASLTLDSQALSGPAVLIVAAVDDITMQPASFSLETSVP